MAIESATFTYTCTCRIHKDTKQLVAIKILNLDTAEGTHHLCYFPSATDCIH